LVEYRPWKGKNGKVINAIFLSRSGDTLLLQIKGREKPTPVKIDGLSRETRAWFERCIKARDAVNAQNKKDREARQKMPKNSSLAKKIVLPEGQVKEVSIGKKLDILNRKLAPLERVNRRNIPNFDQGEYGKKASDCVPNSYAMFIGWWHASGWVKMPESRKAFGEQVGWLHDRLARCMKTRNNSGTRANDIAEHLQKFFQDEMKTPVAFTHSFDYDYRPENLAKYVQGANATVLYLTTYSGRKKQGGHAVTVKNLEADGSIEFNTWGMSLTGKLKLIPGEKSKSFELRKMMPVYEIELSKGTVLPDWFVNEERRFVLEASEYDCLSVLTPYLPDTPADK